MKNIVLFTLLIVCQTALAQSILKGRVISGDTQNPLPSVSVYLNNTSLGTITNEKGEFTIRKIPAVKFRLVASLVSYETYERMLDPHDIADTVFIISLKP
ncbi:MAG TPA: carboxypeptidase-like regulatory domain-containing protein, partial [Puia sp.]